MTEAEVRMFMREWAGVATELSLLDTVRDIKSDLLARTDKITAAPSAASPIERGTRDAGRWGDLLLDLVLKFLDEWIAKQELKLSAFSPELDYAHLQGLDAGGRR